MKSQSYFLMLITSLFLLSCGGKKTVVSSKKKSSSKSEIIVEKEDVSLKKLPSVDQASHVKNLKKKNSNLNKYTLDYIKTYAPLAVIKMHEYKIPASITLAQGILESGSGRSNLARKSNNHFGIKCHAGWEGDQVLHDDDENDECFRKYKFVSSSFNDHSTFLTTRNRYAFLFKIKKNDYKAWAKGLKKAGYATDRKYPQKLISLIETYKLYEFDKVNERDLKKWKKEPIVVEVEEKKVEVVPAVVAGSHTVVKGDTLYSISKKYGLTVVFLKQKNKLKSNQIYIGQKLVLK